MTLDRRVFSGFDGKRIVGGDRRGVLGAAIQAKETAGSADKKKIIVGGHPWVYAATSRSTTSSDLDRIFADMSTPACRGSN